MSNEEKGTSRAQCTTRLILDAVTYANGRLAEFGLSRLAVVVIAEWHYDPTADDDLFRAQLLDPDGRLLCATIARSPASAARMLVRDLENDFEPLDDEDEERAPRSHRLMAPGNLARTPGLMHRRAHEETRDERVRRVRA